MEFLFPSSSSIAPRYRISGNSERTLDFYSKTVAAKIVEFVVVVNKPRWLTRLDLLPPPPSPAREYKRFVFIFHRFILAKKNGWTKCKKLSFKFLLLGKFNTFCGLIDEAWRKGILFIRRWLVFCWKLEISLFKLITFFFHWKMKMKIVINFENWIIFIPRIRLRYKDCVEIFLSEIQFS